MSHTFTFPILGTGCSVYSFVVLSAFTNKLESGRNAAISNQIGIIRSGVSFDDDPELYENVILEKSDIVIK